MYLDLLTSASLLDHTVWTSPDVLASDTWATAADLAAKRKSRGGFGFFGVICCVLIVALIVVGIVLFTRRKKN